MSYNVINLISLLHVQFYKSHYYLINQYTFLQKRVYYGSKIYFMRVAKYACLIYLLFKKVIMFEICKIMLGNISN